MVNSNGKFTDRAIPEPTLRRLPIYQNYLKKIMEKGVEFTSCTQLSEALKFLPIQIRKDLAFTGIIGKPKVGYEVKELLETIENFLGWNNTDEAFLVGVGNLGAALLSYQGFKICGLEIIAAFDINSDKIGTEINGKKIFDINKLGNLIKRMKILIGIITVPGEFAQKVADIMIESGIKAIWNFAPVRINVPEGVIVQHENIASSFTVLSKKLQKSLSRE